eukprot:2395209-Prymnesium_polylepis.2
MLWYLALPVFLAPPCTSGLGRSLYRRAVSVAGACARAAEAWIHRCECSALTWNSHHQCDALLPSHAISPKRNRSMCPASLRIVVR